MHRKHVLIISLLLAIAVPSFGQSSDAIATITAESLNAKLRAKGDKPLVVDVREAEEFEAGHIAGAMLAPLTTVDKAVADVAKDREIALVCRSGRRSALAYRRLAELGYTRLLNLEGGMLAWEKLGYEVVKK
jgi:rhodanese-related sulfurtransferase